MKRLLILTFLLSIIPTTQSVAVTDEYCQEQSEIIDKKCQYFSGTQYLPVAGCKYDEKQKKCVACPVGFYGANCSDKCISDGVLDSINTLSITKWGGATGATTKEECSWWLNCPVTSQWVNEDTGCQTCTNNGFVAYEHRIGYANGEIKDEENTNYTCQTCGENSIPDGTSESNYSDGACFCDGGYHIKNSSYNTTETNQPNIDCVPATYRIRIYKNRPWVSEDSEYIDLYVRTGSNKLVQDTNTSDTTPADNGRDTWFDAQSAVSNWPTLSDTPADGTTYKLTAYNTVAGDPYARPGTQYKWTALTDDINLYAQWLSIGTYTVQYGNTTGPDTTSDLIEIDINKPHTVLNPFPCNLDTFTDEFYRGWNRQKFTGWKIYINDEYSQTISIKDLQDGNITVQGAAGDTIYLEGQTEPCPAGYYCNPEQCYENEDKNKSFVYLCDEGYYCPEGSATQEKCPAGYYCETQEIKTECPAGSYCPQGSQKPKSCPTDLTSKAGAATITECGITNTTRFTDNNDKSLQLRLGNGVILPCKWCTEQSSSI